MILENILEIILDALKDTAILIPFLFLTYLLMEFLEHKTSDKFIAQIKKSGKFGPILGGVLGLVPQCGFSASATTLYSGRIITLGTLISIYLTTSDEMIPILITAQMPLYKILAILAIKFVVGFSIGFLVDFIYSKKIISSAIEKTKESNPQERKAKEEKEIQESINQICEHDHCNCSSENIFVSSIKHTLNIALYIFIITFCINLVIEFIGEDNLIALFNGNKFLGPILASVIGLIPNCASSVILSQMYVDNIISIATLIAGLLVNAGISILILFKTNKNVKENIQITSILLITGIVVGIVLNVLNFTI